MIDTSRKGFIAIITVLVILVFSLSIAIGTTYLSIGGSQSASAFSQGDAALLAAEGCAEDALLHAVRDETYSGGSYGYLNATCDVNVSVDGTTWTFDISATQGAFKRSLEVIASRQVTVPATFVLQSWREN